VDEWKALVGTLLHVFHDISNFASKKVLLVVVEALQLTPHLPEPRRCLSMKVKLDSARSVDVLTEALDAALEGVHESTSSQDYKRANLNGKRQQQQQQGSVQALKERIVTCLQHNVTVAGGAKGFGDSTVPARLGHQAQGSAPAGLQGRAVQVDPTSMNPTLRVQPLPSPFSSLLSSLSFLLSPPSSLISLLTPLLSPHSFLSSLLLSPLENFNTSNCFQTLLSISTCAATP